MCPSNYVPILFLCFLVGNRADFSCYSKFCVNNTVLPPKSEHRCELTRIQKKNNKACVEFDFPNSADKILGNFKLGAHALGGTGAEAYTALNLSIANIQFDRLYIRYRGIDNPKFSACREIRLYDNGKDPVPTELFVDCPFLEKKQFDTYAFKLEMLASKDDYQYTKTFVFEAPSPDRISNQNVSEYAPFMYVDLTERNRPHLHIQPAPAKFNVTGYHLWLSTQDTQFSKDAEIKLVKTFTNNETLEYILDDFPSSGYYRFISTLLHPDCGAYGCLNSTTRLTEAGEHSSMLIITIASLIWVPPTFFYVLYRIHTMKKQKDIEKIKNKETYCLLVSSPTHITHVEVMTDLTKYLRSCNIKAQFDQMDIPNTWHKDPTRWCDEAFERSDVIVMVSSPPPKNLPVPVIYTNMDNHALRLMKENYSLGKKKYFALQLPYCNADDLPQSAQKFKKLNIPEDLDKLVRLFHGDKHIKIIGESREKLLKSIEVAKGTVLYAEPEKIEETVLESVDCITLQRQESTVDLDSDENSINEDANESIEDIEINTFETKVHVLLDGDTDSEGHSLRSFEQEYEPFTRVEDLLNL